MVFNTARIHTRDEPPEAAWGRDYKDHGLTWVGHPDYGGTCSDTCGLIHRGPPAHRAEYQPMYGFYMDDSRDGDYEPEIETNDEALKYDSHVSDESDNSEVDAVKSSGNMDSPESTSA